MWQNREIEYVAGELAVILEPNAKRADVDALLRSLGVTVKHNFNHRGWGLIELPAAVDLLKFAGNLEKRPMIKVAEPNMVDRAHYNPDDTYYDDGHQYGLHNTGQNPPSGTSDADIDAPEAWEITMGSSSITIAILDSGIPLVSGSLSHPDLNDASKFILGPDYSGTPGNGVKDERGHGTHVAGIAAAETDNDTGIAGVCGDCKVMVIQVFDASGTGAHSYFYNGVIYAVDNGADVINYSGGGTPSTTKEDAVDYAESAGVLLVASVDNQDGSIVWPAAYSTSYDNVIAVGATDYDDVRASYSNYGSELNVVAPGGAHDNGYPVDAGDIYSTMPNYAVTLNGSPWYVSQNYGYLPGTSMAAPFVSGLAGLILSVDNSITPSQVRALIEVTADDKGAAGFDNYYGHGRINAHEAVAAAGNGAPAAPVQLGPRGIQTVIGYGGYRKPKIRWTSAGEADLAGFEIERSEDGDPFAPLWNVTIGPTVRSHIDQEVNVDGPGDVTVTYRLRAFDVLDNYSPYSNTKSIQVGGFIAKSLADGAEGVSIPKEYALSGAYPNPFNPSTTLRYGLPEASQLSLRIYNITGREITSWYIDQSAGYHSITWPGTNRSGLAVPSGLYFYVLEAKSAISDSRFTDTGKMLLLK